MTWPLSELWRCHGSLRVRSHGVGRQFNARLTEGSHHAPRPVSSLAILAVMLVAPGCGGGEERAPADPVENAGPQGATSDVETAGATSPDAPASLEADLGENVVADAPRVQLGDRFTWCAKVQALWDAEDEARAETEATAEAHLAATGVLEAATDDLDRADAQEAVERALGDHGRARVRYGHARSLAAGLISGESTPVGW